MPPEICNCGLIKQQKAGTYAVDGVERCRSCNRPITFIPDAPTSMTLKVGDYQEAVHGYVGGRNLPPVSITRVTTLPELPGHRIVAVHGAVSFLSGAAGLTSGMKGNDALGKCFAGLVRAAADMGGNAVVGLTSSTFGAGGGLTNVFGGDAVGVLLLGTSVTVEPFEAE